MKQWRENKLYRHCKMLLSQFGFSLNTCKHATQLIQMGGGEQNERAIKYGCERCQQWTEVSNTILTDNNKTVDEKNVSRTAFEAMLNQIKKNYIQGTSIGGHLQWSPRFAHSQPLPENGKYDCRCHHGKYVSSVLNSNVDIPSDSSCHIVLGTIKHPREG